MKKKRKKRKGSFERERERESFVDNGRIYTYIHIHLLIHLGWDKGEQKSSSSHHLLEEGNLI